MSATPRTVHRPALVLLVAVVALVALALGWWQWERFSSAGGTAQNLGYAVQWPLFAGFAWFAYFRFVRLEQDAGAHALDAASDGSPASPASPSDSAATRRATARASRFHCGLLGPRRPRQANTPREIPAGFLPERRTAARDHDPVLAEYNSYLARLNADEGGAGSSAGAARDSERRPD